VHSAFPRGGSEATSRWRRSHSWQAINRSGIEIAYRSLRILLDYELSMFEAQLSAC
jgi:hypothetical protein